MHWIWIRIAAALTALSGVVAGFIVNVDRAAREGQQLGDVLANYFSLFTIVSSLLSVAILVTAASWSERHPGSAREPLAIALGMAAVAAPVILLGLVYNLLLRGMPSTVALGDSAGIHLLDTYAVDVLHVVMPIYFVLDLLLAPRRRGLPWWSLGVIVGYPLVWITYTMVRGEIVANPDGSTPWWYPYPFLDPHGAGGYGSVFAYIGAIFAGFLAIGAMIVATGRYRERRAARRSAVHAPGALPV
ncbi:Pr6Pr family membrane protein [Microbacterium sp. SS28]|uniref:Pr6Pr family membrane protein n=1 Tax=Microbacterium sp. SS28 TaxID=2919948 RepID=UPI001FAAEE74|nr:Pr6Pr family membrane protein [Microbacterium sp. SS28]